MISTYEVGSPHQQDGVVNTLEALNVVALLDTPEKRRDFFKGLDFEQFVTLTDTISESIVFDVSEALTTDTGNIVITSKRRDAASPQKVDYWQDYITPPRRHKEALLRRAFAVAQEQEDMEAAATLLGLSISTVHPYADSNGRTARVLYALLTRGYDGSDTDKAHYRILGSHAGRRIQYLSQTKADLPGLFVMRELEAREICPGDLFYRAERPSNWKWRVGTALGEHALKNALSESYFGIIPLFEGMDVDVPKEQYGKKVMVDEQERLVLQVDKVFPSPWHADRQTILNQQLEHKLAYVNAVIDCFKSDEVAPLVNPQVLVETYRPKSLLALFI